MAANDRANRVQIGHGRDNRIAFHGVRLHDLVLFRRQLAGLAQNRIVDADLADVVQWRAEAKQFLVLVGQIQPLREKQREIGDACGMAAGVFVAKFDGLSQDGDGIEKQIALFLHQLRAFDADRGGGGQGVGEVEVVLAERLLPEVSIQVEDAELSPRGAKQDAHDGSHGAVGDALSHFQVGIFIDAAAEDRFAALVAALGEAVAEMESSGGIAGQRTKLKGTFAVGEHDRAALGVEDHHRIVQNRMQQFGFAFEMRDVMAGAKQGPQLFAWPRAAIAIEGQAVEGLFPRLVGGGLDIYFAFNALCGAGGFVQFDNHGDLAELNDVASVQGAILFAHAHAVDKSAVGAVEIVQHPALLADAKFGVLAADRAVVENNFQRVEAACAAANRPPRPCPSPRR